MALERSTLDDIRFGLKGAEHWLRLAIDADEDRRDARVYLLLTQALEHVALSTRAPLKIAEDLRREAVMRYHWDEPREGSEWLFPPHGAELEWIPLVDRLVAISERLTEPSWLDVATVLKEVVNAYVSVRSIRPRLLGVERVVKPAIEAAFVRETGLLAHLSQWLDREAPDDIDSKDAYLLRRNIEELLRRDVGKAKRTIANGPQSSSEESGPG